MPQIAVRLSAEELALLDQLVAEEHFASRAAVIRDALARLRKEREDREMAEELRRAYERVPETQEERDLGDRRALAGRVDEGRAALGLRRRGGRFVAEPHRGDYP